MVAGIYKVQPEPPDEASCKWFEAGNLTLGVEYRSLDPARLQAVFGADAAAMAEIDENSPDGGFADEGFSIHVKGTADGHEYLRFDLFLDEPHYHYVRPTNDHNHIFAYDPEANGPMVGWAIDRLRTRLPEMLTAAGGEALVDGIDAALVERAVQEIAAVAGAIGDA